MKSKSRFRKETPPAELRARTERRRRQTAARTARYRETLKERRCPDLRDLAETLLIEFLAGKSNDETVISLGNRFYRRMAAKGFSPTETDRRIRDLHRGLVLNSA